MYKKMDIHVNKIQHFYYIRQSDEYHVETPDMITCTCMINGYLYDNQMLLYDYCMVICIIIVQLLVKFCIFICMIKKEKCIFSQLKDSQTKFLQVKSIDVMIN